MSKDSGSPLLRHFRDERGASLVEYALLVALIAVVLMGAVTFLGGSAGTSLSRSGSSISSVAAAG